MSKQTHIERGEHRRENVAAIHNPDHSDAEAKAAAAADFLDEVDEVLDENTANTDEIDNLMGDIDRMFGEVDAETLVRNFVQKGGQ